MKFTRAIALCALTLAIALAIGAISPYQPYASAGQISPIFSSAPERARPTPALATAEPTQIPQVVVQLPPPTPQVIYIQLPAAPPPQVIYVQSPAEIPAAAPLAEELPPAAPAEIPAAAPVEQPVVVDLPTIQCPCGVLADTPYEPMTEREQQYSRQRTR